MSTERDFAEPVRRQSYDPLLRPGEVDPLGLACERAGREDTEFSFGPGLVPPGKERALPEAGGYYRGTTPRRGRPSARDYDAPGHPGRRVR
jgi:hypothetical protein